MHCPAGTHALLPVPSIHTCLLLVRLATQWHDEAGNNARARKWEQCRWGEQKKASGSRVERGGRSRGRAGHDASPRLGQGTQAARQGRTCRHRTIGRDAQHGEPKQGQAEQSAQRGMRTQERPAAAQLAPAGAATPFTIASSAASLVAFACWSASFSSSSSAMCFSYLQADAQGHE